MALHINLYHEIITQEIQRKRDPLKLSSYAIAGVAVLLLGYYGLRQAQLRRLKQEQASRAAEVASLEPKAAAATKEAAELDALIKTSGVLTARIESRFFWAPLFEEVAKVAPREVQITSLNGETPRDKPGSFVVMIGGLAASDSPRTTAEDFRTSLLKALAAKYQQVTATFRSLDESSEQVVVGDVPKSAVNFIILIRNNDTSAEPAASISKP